MTRDADRTPAPHPAYHRLPTSIRAHVSAEEHLWMGERQRDRLMEEFCCPECDEELDYT